MIKKLNEGLLFHWSNEGLEEADLEAMCNFNHVNCGGTLPASFPDGSDFYGFCSMFL